MQNACSFAGVAMVWAPNPMPGVAGLTRQCYQRLARPGVWPGLLGPSEAQALAYKGKINSDQCQAKAEPGDGIFEVTIGQIEPGDATAGQAARRQWLGIELQAEGQARGRV